MNEPSPPQTTDRHSPGPWRAARTPINPWWKVYIEGHEVAEIEGGSVTVYNDPNHPDAVESNARLIAAAPELLALARQYASECSGCDGRGFTVGDDGITGRGPDDVEPTRYACEDCEDIRAVIAKAEGKL